VLRDGKPPALKKADIYPYTATDLVTLGTMLSQSERKADAASWDVIAWLKCDYMQAKIGEEFTGIISKVTNFGLFVELKDVYVEGLLHVTALTNDYYHYDEVTHTLTGERSGQAFRGVTCQCGRSQNRPPTDKRRQEQGRWPRDSATQAPTRQQRAAQAPPQVISPDTRAR